MGLNVDCSHLVDRKLLTAETKRQRDRCFYTVYLQDQYVSSTGTLVFRLIIDCGVSHTVEPLV